MKYINLRNFTHYSEGLGVGTASSYIKRALEVEHDGVCVTDHSDLSAAFELYEKSKASKLPSVIGVNLYVTENIKHRDREDKHSRLMVFAKNQQGFKKISEFISKASTPDYFYFKPRVDINELLASPDGIICSSGCAASIFAKYILDPEGTGEEEALVLRFKKAFGDDFYIEIVSQDLTARWSKDANDFVDDGYNSQEIVNKRMLELAKKHGIKSYLSSPAYMPTENLKAVQDIAVATVKKDSVKFPKALYLKPKEEVLKEAKEISGISDEDEIKSLMETSMEIAEKCNGLKLNFSPILPEIDVKGNRFWGDEALNEKLVALGNKYSDRYIGYLIRNILAGDDKLKLTLLLVIQYNKIDLDDEVYLSRLEEELLVTQRNGYIQLAGYFLLIDLLIYNVINESDEYGPIEEKGYGRGSSAASLLNYALDVTDVDPIKMKLLYSRFQTRDRIGRVLTDLDEIPRNSVVR